MTSLCKMVATMIILVAKIKCATLHGVSTADQNGPTLKSFEECSDNGSFRFQQFLLLNGLIYR